MSMSTGQGKPRCDHRPTELTHERANKRSRGCGTQWKRPSGNFDVTTDVYSGGGGRQDHKHMTKERPAGNQLCPKTWEMRW